MRSHNRTIVESKHTLHHSFEVFWNVHRAGSPPIRDLSCLISFQRYSESLAQISDCSRESHRTPREAHIGNGEVVIVGKGLHRGNIGRIGTSQTSQFLAREVLPLAE